MIELSVVTVGLLVVIIWLVRENRRLTQMVIARHTGEITAMARAERKNNIIKKKDSTKDEYHTWRIPSEGVAP